MHTPLEKYFTLRVQNLFNLLHDFELEGDDVALHDLRVEIKKFRTIIKFLREIYPKQKLKKAAHLLRSIFQQAGEIREYQLMQQWLQKRHLYIIEKKYYPPETLDKMIGEFQEQTEHTIKDLNEVIDTVKPLVENTNEILAQQYFTALNAQAEKMCYKKLSPGDWHELRKLLKQRIYAYNWLTHDAQNNDPNFSYYNRLQEIIGLWHDLEIIKDSFSQKQVNLSQDIEVQKEFAVAWRKLKLSLKYREKQLEGMLSKQLVQN